MSKTPVRLTSVLKIAQNKIRLFLHAKKYNYFKILSFEVNMLFSKLKSTAFKRFWFDSALTNFQFNKT